MAAATRSAATGQQDGWRRARKRWVKPAGVVFDGYRVIFMSG
jgi:hypothetical protein